MQELHTNALGQLYNPVRQAGSVSTVHWHVLGAGAIGCLFASALRHSGCPTTLLLRAGEDQDAATIKVEREDQTTQVQLAASPASAPGHIGHLLVTTKAQDVRDAVLSVAHRLDASSQVLLLVNGLGFDHTLRTELPAPAYFHGSTTEGAYRLERWHIRHAGRGVTRIGQPGLDSAPDWFGQWRRAVKPSHWDPLIAETLWLKLAINCAINPLSALHRCSNGELAGPQLAPQVAALCDEVIDVSTAAGFAKVTTNLHQQVADVISATAGNRSSKLQDVLAGRPTEIDYINGHLIEVARQYGISTPHNEALYDRIIKLGN